MLTEIGYAPRNGGVPVDPAGMKRNPEISIEMSRIDEALNILDKCLGDHYQRITPILRQEPQSTDSNRLSGAEEHRASALGSALQQLRYKIERMTGTLSGVSTQVEL